MRRVLPGIGIGLVVALFLGAAGFWFWNDYKDRQRQAAEFKAEAVALGYTIGPAEKGKKNPHVEDETEKVHGIERTETIIELRVVVRGCIIELARRKDQKATANVAGRTLRIYEVDESVNSRGGELEIDNGPTSPTPAQVETYLTNPANSARFTHCLNPAVTAVS